MDITTLAAALILAGEGGGGSSKMSYAEIAERLYNNTTRLTDQQKLKIETWLGLSENYLTYYNTTPYTVDSDYIPAHKKYVDSVAGKINYSTTEQKTGQKWIDGKDIYQKTYVIPMITIVGWTNAINDTSLNLERLISCETSSTTNYIESSCVLAKYDDGVISIYNGWGIDVDTITIRYTKKQ